MKKIFFFSVCLTVISFTISGQSSISSNFFIKANEWYVLNISSKSFNSSVNDFLKQDFNITYTIADNTNTQPDIQADINNMIREEILRSHIQNDDVNAYLQSYLSLSRSYHKQKDKPWYGIVGNALGSLLAGTY